MNYALLTPSAIESTGDTGRYNAYQQSGAQIPFRYFSLPCPDVAIGGDQNLDGISDILQTHCGSASIPVTVTTALAAGSRYGRLPWREDVHTAGTDFTYVRGLGGVDLRDGFNQRFWYGVSDNLIDPVYPLSPHVLMRMTTGWLTAIDRSPDAPPTDKLLSQRVAAFVVAPGLLGDENAGSRISEEALSAINPALVTVNNFVAAYLNTLSYDNFFTTGEVILRGENRKDGTNAAQDRIAYLTIEDLAADGGEGIAVLENAPSNIYDMLAGENGFFGAVALLGEHLQRHGFLPEPAVFDEAAVSLQTRPGGIPVQTDVALNYINISLSGSVTVTTTLSRGSLPVQQPDAKISTSVNISLVIRLSDLPPVYLASSTTLTAYSDVHEPLPPYGRELAALETALTYTPLPSARVAQLTTDAHYPVNGIGGLSGLVNATLTATYGSPLVVPRPLNASIGGGDFVVILSEGGYGYFADETLVSLIVYAKEDPEGVAQLPPYAAKAYLPAGTRLTLNSADLQIKLPVDYVIPPGSFYDPDTGEWVLDSGSATPVQIIAGADKWVTVQMSPPRNFPVVAGDIGFLPIENSPQVVNVSAGLTVILAADALAMSYLATEMTLVYLGATVTAGVSNFHQSTFPFFPGELVGYFGAPSPPLVGLPDPMALAGINGVVNEFTAPAGTRVIYPAGSQFVIGDQFAFPKGSIFHLPAGTRTNQGVGLGSSPLPLVLPDGSQTTVTGYQTVTLVHGGLAMALADDLSDAGQVYPRRGSNGVIADAVSQSFDIELLQGNSVMGTVTVSGNHIIRPLSGKLMEGSDIASVTIASFYADSYYRAGFLTRPRHIRVPANNAIAVSPYEMPVVLNVLGIDDNSETAALAHNGTTLSQVSVVFDEDTQFFLPPAVAVSINVSDVTTPAGVVVSLVREVVLPPQTGIFDKDMFPSAADITLVTGGYPRLFVTENPITVSLVQTVTVAGSTVMLQNRLALFPETDMYVDVFPSGVSLVAAGSIADLLEGNIYPPGASGVSRVAPDIGLRSSGAAYLYLEAPVTLRGDVPVNYIVDRVGTLTAVAVSLNGYAHHLESYRLTTAGLNLYGRHVTISNAFIERNIYTAELPAGSYISLPPGAEIDLLSDEIGDASDVTLADTARLPAKALAFIPPGVTATIVHYLLASATITATTTVAAPGPFYMQLADEGGAQALAFVNASDHITKPPLLFLTEDAYLYDNDNTDAKTRLYSSVPAGTLLDLYGRMKNRRDSGFYANLMPADSRQLFQDFPMLYAVAPECRLSSGHTPGSACADADGEGLNFTLEPGEEYILREPLDIPAAALVTSAYAGVSLAVEVMDFNGANSSSYTAESLLVMTNGLVTMQGANPAHSPQPNQQLVVRANGDSTQNEIRSYMDSSAILTTVDLATISYAAVEGALTLYSGGYVGTNYADAVGGASLNVGSTLSYGVGAHLGKVAGGEKIFGADSEATLTFSRSLPGVPGVFYQATVDISDYVVVPTVTTTVDSDFSAEVDLSADAYDLDRHGDFYAYYGGDTVGVGVITVDTRTLSEVEANAADERSGLINVFDGYGYPMQSGYLWQGYVPPESEFVMQQNTVQITTYLVTVRSYNISISLDMSGSPSDTSGDNPLITTGIFPNNRLHWRIQSTVAQLNSWGSGLERPEGLDRASESYFQQSLDIDGAPSGMPYFSYGASRHIRTEATKFSYSDYFLPPWSLTLATPRLLDASFTTLPATISFVDEALHSFAGLIDGTNPRALNRKRGSLTMQIAVRDAATGDILNTLSASWQPVVFLKTEDSGITSTVAVTGYIRINSGSGSPLPDSGVEDGFDGAVVTSWARYYQSVDETADWLPLEWMGRYNRADTPEDGQLTFLLNGNAVTAVFNMPHTDLAGSGIKFRIWPSNEHAQAYPNVSSGAAVPVTPGAYNSFSSARPSYTPVDYLPEFNSDYLTVTVTIAGGTSPAPGYHRDFETTTAVTVTAATDWMFYVDSAYHAADGGVYSPVPQQTLYFGDNFRIPGPAALVPPFGGRSETATRQVYAERSLLFSELFADANPIPLHLLYDDLSGDCIVNDDCENMYHNPHWFPLLGGVAAFEGLEVAFTTTLSSPPLGNDEVRLVFPEPQGQVRTADGNMATIYAGSIIYPRRQLIYSANPLPGGNWRLYPEGAVLAHVDTSPVHRAMNHEVRRPQAQALDGGVFNYAPVTVSQGGNNYIVEPLGFETPGPHFEFDLRAVARSADVSVVYTGGFYGVTITNTFATDSPICLAAAALTVSAFYMGCGENQYANYPVNGPRQTQNPSWYRYGVIHDVGVTATLAIAQYPNEFATWTAASNHLGVTVNYNTVSRPTFAATITAAGRNYTYEPIRYDGSFNRGYIADDDGRALLMDYYGGQSLFISTLRYQPLKIANNGAATVILTTSLPTRSTDVPLGNPAAYQWQVSATTHFIPLGIADFTITAAHSQYNDFTYSTVGVQVSTDADEFNALRLAHEINIPANAVITMGGFALQRYPHRPDNFFTLPAGSEAIVVNADMGSWLGAHPYIGLYQQGLDVQITVSPFPRQTVMADNDSFQRIPLAGRHVVHYQRSEPSQHMEPLSAVPIYTNVWLRLPAGGWLVNQISREVIQLRPDSIVNPVAGTYINVPGRGVVGVLSDNLRNQYRANAVVQTVSRIVRPALTLPAGARLVMKQNGSADIRNVKAAVLFSLTPIELMQCPTGQLDGFNGQSGRVGMSQIHEGVREDRYMAGALPDERREIGTADPCVWLDDPENLDGDRNFIYRSRRRYRNDDIRAVTRSNDRTYLLGGKLELRV